MHELYKRGLHIGISYERLKQNKAKCVCNTEVLCNLYNSIC